MAAPGSHRVTRWVNGINNVADNNILADFGMPDPSKWIVHFDDFVNYNAADWTVTAVGTGTAPAAADINGGAIQTITGAISGNSYYLQKVGRSFLLASNKRAFFKARFKIDNVATSSLIFGLQNSTTTPKTATDGIYFFKSSAATVDLFCRKDTSTGSNSVTGISTMVNDTFTELAWSYDPIDQKVYYAVDGVVSGSISATSAFLPDAQLSMSFGFETNTTAARTGTVDYVFAALER